jgi:hypothetical protein
MTALLSGFLGLVAAVTAALIARSVMTSNHRQAWINGLREDLATFFTAVDVIHAGNPEGQQKARSEALLAYRKILMRLNINEAPHQQLERSLGTFLVDRDIAVNPENIAVAVQLARTILKQEWEVTKYGPLTRPMIRFKTWWRGKKI